MFIILFSPKKQPTFGDATSGFPAKWRLRNERRNSILMMRHYPDLGTASDWLCRVENLIQTNQKHCPDLGSDASSVWNFRVRFSDVIWRETSGSIAKCRLFSQATFFFHLWWSRWPLKIMLPLKSCLERWLTLLHLSFLNPDCSPCWEIQGNMQPRFQVSLLLLPWERGLVKCSL